MGRGLRDGLIAGVFIFGIQLAYRLYPDYFAPMMLFAAVALLFYRKLDRIERALSEERRHREFQQHKVAGPAALAFVVVTVIVAVAGSYLLWKVIFPTT